MYYTAHVMDYLRGMELAISNALVFDGQGPELIEATVRVIDGVIASVGDEPPAAGAEVLDARGGTVVPGLIDAHFHAYATGLDVLAIHATPLSYVALEAARRLESALRRGFTTVRDVAGGDPGLSRAIENGLIRAPRYLYTGPALSQTGGHGDPRPGDADLCAHGEYMTEVVDGIDDLRRAVRERFRRGAHAIKVMTSGGVVSPSDPIRRPQYSAGEIRAVTEEAERRGSYVAAHAYSPEAIAHSVSGGVRSIEHGNLLDPPTADLMASHGAYLVPTLAAYEALDRRGAELGLSPVSQAKNREVLHAGQQAIRLAREAGVPIGWGSDLMGPLEDHQLHGLRLQVEVEGPLETLRSATSVNAALLRREDLGRIAVGARGDLVIFAGNPIDDPALLWSADGRTVIAGGRRI
jgi:imidazolonepropionase-like amidohydrolase